MSTQSASLAPSGAVLKIGGWTAERCYLDPSDEEYYVDLDNDEEILRHGVSVVPSGTSHVRVKSGDILTRRARN